MLNNLPAYWLARRYFFPASLRRKRQLRRSLRPRQHKLRRPSTSRPLRATRLIPTRKLSTGRKPATTRAGLVAGAGTPRKPVSLKRQTVQPQDKVLNRHSKFDYVYSLKYDDRFRFDCKK